MAVELHQREGDIVGEQQRGEQVDLREDYEAGCININSVICGPTFHSSDSSNKRV
jgi:hypothetical protein